MPATNKTMLALTNLPIADGATVPDPGTPGALAWSTVLLDVVSWNGTSWSKLSSGGVMSGALASVPLSSSMSVPAPLTAYDQLYAQRLAARDTIALQGVPLSANAVRPVEYFEPSMIDTGKHYWEATHTTTPAVYGWSLAHSAPSVVANPGFLTIRTAAAVQSGAEIKLSSQLSYSLPAFANSPEGFFAFRILLTDFGVNAPAMLFLGLQPNQNGLYNFGTSNYNIEPSQGQNGSVGFMKDSGDSTLHFGYTTLGSGNPVYREKVNTGLPITTATSSYWMDLVIAGRAPSPQNVSYAFRRTVSSTDVTWSAWSENTLYPQDVVGGGNPNVFVGNGAAGGVKGIGVAHVYAETGLA